MRITKRLPALVCSLVLCMGLALPAYAHDVPDENRTGSVSFTMTYDGAAVGGGSLTLYRVGDVAEDDGNYSFALSEDYAGCGVTLDDITDATLAKTLADYTTENGVEGVTVEIGEDGTAKASGLTLGLYLVMQHQAASGYEAIAPFLVSVPMLEDGVYVYDVDATPKMSALTKTPPQPVNPQEPETPGSVTPTTPTAPAQGTLPQTGQLNWPVPVLTVAGLLLILAGWYLRSRSKEATATHGCA